MLIVTISQGNEHTSAHFEALSMLLIAANRTIYIHPYVKLINEQTNDTMAVDRVTGSAAASGIWKIVRIALFRWSVFKFGN